MMVGSLAQVRAEIDKIDETLIALIARRGEFVKQAATFKKTAAQVAAPERMQQVIDKVTKLAADKGADIELVENLYRQMIADFIRIEHLALKVNLKD
ncbi:chorismate mutase [Pseudolactococcus reticulitermitis]|uniref:Isochorismate pyruvate-lyase n=1 Tax=Pseudolactococcus reticulitermitis TaxID=2025039 RepID=A0A224X4Z6_9LACT|nr:chorismate mutase [Lactococcus reticulitermitis]GAX46650.1 isochorismate pyruvate-lyase [Lactococcus reticulitermitis]